MKCSRLACLITIVIHVGRSGFRDSDMEDSWLCDKLLENVTSDPENNRNR